MYTQEHDVTARLQRILSNEGIHTAVLRASVDTSKREAWYARQVKDGVQVVICHPKLVETGSICWTFRPSFSTSLDTLCTLCGRPVAGPGGSGNDDRAREVSLLGRDDADSVFTPHGKKLLVALTMEGKFAGEGLQSIDEDDDMLSAMARELVERNGIGETADSVWRALNAEHQKLFPGRSRSDDDPSFARCRIFCWTLRLSPRVLLKALWTRGLRGLRTATAIVI